MISGFQARRQARAPVTGLDPATEGSLQISEQIRSPLCHHRPPSRIHLRIFLQIFGRFAIYNATRTQLKRGKRARLQEETSFNGFA
ncbi:hypothetical protein PoB_000803000 [Plakobranchus ocellatus]|uniref:Uncharacterized protein n=1 Tax=Plakobranchus ocellatus TaxID=259542 RepID=A0AAV3YFJ9_9GAST|nr:hypothetical protein PoB_000803000 [Plakobranchus ocellatus]